MEGGEGIPQTSPLIWRLPQHSPDSTPKLTFTDPKTHRRLPQPSRDSTPKLTFRRSEEHTSELKSLMRISYAVSSLKKNTADSFTVLPPKTSNTKALFITSDTNN